MLSTVALVRCLQKMASVVYLVESCHYWLFSLPELRGGKIVFVADASILCITLQQLQVSEDV